MEKCKVDLHIKEVGFSDQASVLLERSDITKEELIDFYYKNQLQIIGSQQIMEYLIIMKNKQGAEKK